MWVHIRTGWAKTGFKLSNSLIWEYIFVPFQFLILGTHFSYSFPIFRLFTTLQTVLTLKLLSKIIRRKFQTFLRTIAGGVKGWYRLLLNHLHEYKTIHYCKAIIRQMIKGYIRIDIKNALLATTTSSSWFGLDSLFWLRRAEKKISFKIPSSSLQYFIALRELHSYLI